jgi:hypothetical protein
MCGQVRPLTPAALLRGRPQAGGASLFLFDMETETWSRRSASWPRWAGGEGSAPAGAAGCFSWSEAVSRTSWCIQRRACPARPALSLPCTAPIPTAPCLQGNQVATVGPGRQRVPRVCHGAVGLDFLRARWASAGGLLLGSAGAAAHPLCSACRGCPHALAPAAPPGCGAAAVGEGPSADGRLAPGCMLQAAPRAPRTRAHCLRTTWPPTAGGCCTTSRSWAWAGPRGGTATTCGPAAASCSCWAAGRWVRAACCCACCCGLRADMCVARRRAARLPASPPARPHVRTHQLTLPAACLLCSPHPAAPRRAVQRDD